MAEVLVTESSSDGESGYDWSPRRRLGEKRKRRWRRPPAEPPEIIDLTGDDITVIDLTGTEDDMISPLHDSYSAIQDLKHSTPVSMHSVCCPKILTTKSAENKVDVPISMWDRDCELPSPQEDAIKKQPLFQCSSCPIIPSYGGDSENSSHTTYNSDLGSLGSPQVGSDVFSFSSTPSSSECQAPLDCVDEVPGAGLSVEEPSPQHSPLHQRHSPSPIPSCSPMSTSPPLAEANQHFLEANNPAPNAVKSDVWAPAKQIDIKVWLKTLQYFQGVPVHHPFFQNVVQEKDAEQKKQPIPSRKLSMVFSTIEEKFFQGTLDFLMDYVTSQHYPPKEITSCVIRQILLSSDQQDVQQETQKDAYMLLMKIQSLHPARADTVVWDWLLLRVVIEEQEGKFPGRLLFLQYVIQTLEDDFQRMARIGTLHKSIAKAVLSCDHCFDNVKEVIEWLVAAVMGIRVTQYRRHVQKTIPSLETSRAMSSSSVPGLHLNQTAQTDDVIPQFQSQTEVAFLQRMLSIAIEVDKSPNCSTSKIVDNVFYSWLNIPKRCHREAFLSSMECHLLRCKVLELVFYHSCREAPDLRPLSLKKILHFLKHCSLQLTYQDNEATWQRWDEMLHQLTLLLLSYRRVVLGHLRSSVCERVNLIIKAARPKLQISDLVERDSVECDIEDFQNILSLTLGQPLPQPIKEKTELLQELLLAAMN
nr:SUMO-interacting motif-containing protein 1 isoform X1 [Podarcis muralis]